MESIRYGIIVDTKENRSAAGLLLHNARRGGTVFNTVAPGANLQGLLRHR